MSWQRILRFAKQRQVPVIITDESGEEPLILLSLDQLEQALDGGAGPDLPPPAPAPRPTTPSFIPEQSVPSSGSEPVQAESPELPATPLPAALSTFAELEQVAEPLAQPAIDIITPPDSEAPKPPPESDQPQPVPPPAPPTTASTRPDLSLEERFFLDF